MKLVPIAGSVIATMLAVAGCSSTRYAAVRSAEENAEEAREEAREAREDAEHARHEAAEADQKALLASQRAAQAQAEANRYVVAPVGVTERQPDGTIFFDPDSADLSADADARLDDAVRAIRARGPGHTIVIQGYTDASGSEYDNIALSQRRARAVADYCVVKGISRDRIVIRGFGSHHPLSRDDTDRGRALNRRVEILIQP